MRRGAARWRIEESLFLGLGFIQILRAMHGERNTGATENYGKGRML